MSEITIDGPDFRIDGELTYPGVEWRGHRIEGLLMNNRVVQATFDDLNPETRDSWAYPDTGTWDPERNVAEFIDALPAYYDAGLLAVTVNFQGGNPRGYHKDQPWENNAFEPDGAIRPAFLDRMRRVLDATDRLGMAVILGVFYFGQDQRLEDEQAVVRALDNVVHWLLDRGYRNVLLEVNNECNVKKYVQDILMPARVSELIDRVRETTVDGRRLLVGTSYGGRFIPLENVVRVSDFLLIHGNGVTDPDRIAEMVEETRAVDGYRPMPILFNEDDHYDFDKPWNNYVAAVSKGASWGLLDIGENNYRDGYQSPPVDWTASTERKRAWVSLMREMTGRA